MKGNKLKVLAISTLVILVLAVFAVNQESNSVKDTQKNVELFPGLADKINSVKELIVSQGPKSVTIKLNDNEWQVVDSDNYPADVSKVKQTIIRIADFKILEAKTSKETNYGKLGVEDTDAKGSKSKLITLKDGSAVELAALIVGKQRSSNISNSNTDSLYVRKAHDRQSWLVKGELYADIRPRDWIRTELFSITADRVSKVVINNGAKPVVTIQKENRADKDFVLLNIPKKKVVKSATTINAISEGVQNIVIQGVKSASNDKLPSFEKDAIVTNFTTYDGLLLSVKTVKKGSKTYAKFSASFDASVRKAVAEPAPTNTEPGASSAPPSPTEPVLKDVPVIEAEVTALNKKFESWVFIISNTKAEHLRQTMDDLVKDV